MTLILTVENMKSLKKIIDNYYLYLFIPAFIFVCLLILFFEGKIYKKENKYTIILEAQIFPFECMGINFHSYGEYYNDFYINKIVNNIHRVHAIYLNDCKPWVITLPLKMILRNLEVLSLFWGILVIKAILKLIRKHN